MDGRLLGALRSEAARGAGGAYRADVAERRTEGQPLVTDFLSVRWCVRLSDPVYRQPFGAYETGQLGFASIFTEYGWPLGPVEFKSNCRPF